MEAAIIITCLLLSAFFSGMEIAYVSSNKVYLGVEKLQSNIISRILSRLTENPVQFVTAMLIGNSVALVIYSYYMSVVALRWMDAAGWDLLPFWEIFFQIVISLFIILITAEFLPKVFFQVYANTLIRFFAVPAYMFYLLFYYLAWGVHKLSDFILLNILRTEGDTKKAYFTKGELGNYIAEQMTGMDSEEEVDSEIQIFQNALEFADLKAREVMTPRTEIAAVEINDPVNELRELFVETGYSKVVVYKESMDNIIGYVHSFELFKKKNTIREMMIAVENVPETIFIKEVLDILTRKRKSMAVVLDEYGGTSGIITIEDIIEELFGEIEDEHDEEEEMEEQVLGEGLYLFSARLDVEYLNEKYDLDIPETDSYSTLGGFAVYHAKEIPKNGEHIQCGDFEITIESATSKKIELIKLRAGAE